MNSKPPHPLDYQPARKRTISKLTRWLLIVIASAIVCAIVYLLYFFAFMDIAG